MLMQLYVKLTTSTLGVKIRYEALIFALANRWALAKKNKV